MSHFPLRRFLCLGLCTLMLLCSAQALEVTSGTAYCFSPEDFSQEEELTGLCLTQLPQGGTLMLGARILRSGDILTAQQLAQTTFLPSATQEDVVATVSYLPIYGNRVEKAATMTINIWGSRDDAPEGADVSLETYKNLPLEGQLQATDPEGKAVTYTLQRQGKRGTAELQADGRFVYTPKKNKVGADSFTFTATDPAGNVSREITVTVRILKPSDKAQYSDTLETDCRFTAEWLRHNEIFVGETVGSQLCFNPEKEVSRGEFLAMVMKVLNIRVPEQANYTGFRDEIPQWLRPYLAAAMNAGLVTGEQTEDGLVFRPNDAITGSEASDILSQAMGSPTWSQGDTAPVWSQQDSPLTRAQAANVLYQLHNATKE